VLLCSLRESGGQRRDSHVGELHGGVVGADVEEELAVGVSARHEIDFESFPTVGQSDIQAKAEIEPWRSAGASDKRHQSEGIGPGENRRRT
jgi:hypothetical protein